MERIVPIYDDVYEPLSRDEIPAARGTLADLLASMISALASLTALGYSILFFTRFLENDSHLWGIIAAFILCFGVGAFGFVPAGFNALIAFRAYKNGAKVKELLWALGLILPWACLSAVLVFISDLPKIYALVVFVTAILLLAWAVISLLKARTFTS